MPDSHRVPWIHVPGAPIPLHADHLGNPTGCNALCDPPALVHAQLAYTDRPDDLEPPGVVRHTVHGHAEVISSRPAPEAPPCPAVPDWTPILTVYRYLTDPRR